MKEPFDLALGYLQWQGSSRSTNILRGAKAVAEVCSRFAPLASLRESDKSGDDYGIHHWNAIHDQFCQAQRVLAEHRPRRLLTAGGDCAVDIAAIDYLHGVYPDMQVIWIDAHMDANTPETTPSGYFHGMPVSAIMGFAPAAMRRLQGKPIAPERFRYYGVRVGDTGDKAFGSALGLRTLEANHVFSGPVHIHFDLDVLDPIEFPYLSYCEPDGVSIAEALALVRRIAAQADLVGLTITEFAPANVGEAERGSVVIEKICQAASGNDATLDSLKKAPARSGA
nr:arginase family protein [Dyella sp. ASV24]